MITLSKFKNAEREASERNEGGVEGCPSHKIETYLIDETNPDNGEYDGDYG